MTDFSFLEVIDSPKALKWATTRSDDTFATVDEKPDRATLDQRLKSALDTDDRIAYVTRRGDTLFNFWRDASHPKGVWRTTTLESYLAEDTSWRTLIDVDKLAQEENENWVWKGAHVRTPDHERALIRLSRGGADATVIREFDLISGEFVTDHPFTVPEAKTDISWLGPDAVLIGTDTGEGSLTTSGYPSQVRTWHRGTDVDSAELFFAGHTDDVAVGAWADRTPGFERVFASRALDFYNEQRFVEMDSGLQILEVPSDCEVTIERQWMFINPREDFAGIPAGGLGVIEFDAFLAGDRNFRSVFTPTASTSLQGIAFTANWLVLTLMENVSTRIHVVPFHDPTSEHHQLTLPEHVTGHVIATSPLDGDEIWVQVASFIKPATLLRGDLSGTLELATVRQAPLQFDNSGLDTRQHWATSADGTKIPYFVTGDLSVQQARPTLVHAYGGFEVSLAPSHSPTRGIAWLEKGHLFVEANIRGGGEFGPEWHSQAVKVNRRKVFEDFHAVLTDLVERGYTSPELIGIRGGSNGGLLTSTILTMFPEAIGAAVVQVPLTDMLRYHTWSAGASWMAEYGDPGTPAEREVLESYSPLHNVDKHADTPYPPALVTTSTRDDRVHPAHARLFALALEEAGQPVDYYENTEGGHAGAADNAQIARVESLIYTWLDNALTTSKEQ